MVDINMQSDVKVHGVVAPVPAIEQEDRQKSPVAPVQPMGDTARSALDDKALHRSPKEDRKLSKDELVENLKAIQSRLNQMGTRLGLDIEETAEVVVAQITDRTSGEVIKQIPSEEVLALRKKIDDLVGILFDSEA